MFVRLVGFVLVASAGSAYLAHPEALSSSPDPGPPAVEVVLGAAMLPAPPVAQMGMSDPDGDGLPTKMERILGTSPWQADSDGDSVSDRIEWLFRTNPLESSSVPTTLDSAVRGFTWLGTAGNIEVYVAVYPRSNRSTLGVYFGSPEIPGDDPDFNIVEITPPVTYTPPHADGAWSTQFPLALELSTHSPASVGMVSGRVSVGDVAVDRIGLIDAPVGKGSAIYEDLVPAPATPPSTASFAGVPLTPPMTFNLGGDEDPEYCRANLGVGDPIGVGAILFEVEDAECKPDGLLYCVDEDCEALEGETIVTIDYGYLQSRAGG